MLLVDHCIVQYENTFILLYDWIKMILNIEKINYQIK